MSKKDIDEEDLKAIVLVLKRSGMVVRREKLSRGVAFRVKSGKCEAFGKNLLFVDKALPVRQQVTMLLDYLVENPSIISEEERSNLPPSVRSILSA